MTTSQDPFDPIPILMAEEQADPQTEERRSAFAARLKAMNLKLPPGTAMQKVTAQQIANLLEGIQDA